MGINHRVFVLPSSCPSVSPKLPCTHPHIDRVSPLVEDAQELLDNVTDLGRSPPSGRWVYCSVEEVETVTCPVRRMTLPDLLFSLDGQWKRCREEEISVTGLLSWNVSALSLCYRVSTVFFVLNLLLPLSERLLWKKCRMPLNVPSQ